ncbi:MAG: peptide ABC transporter substrate-binding protein [Lentisphaerae bacterium GWF2_45_14]|nr:MAG: peptide ABC transporter substrate-binding protein [Lentisphaerae bacterium GWF2_45_14]
MSLVEVQDLKTWYPVKTGLFSAKKHVKALDGVSFNIEKGETVGLVGESGCGKSTLGRTLMCLERHKSGAYRIDGVDISGLSGSELRKARSSFQMIFQDPYGSLNPRMTVCRMLDEVLCLHTKFSTQERKDRIAELLKMVGLPLQAMERYPHQFSGGQRQRIGIARSLAVNPKFIVADEPVSALDVSVQAQIINLLRDIQSKTSIAYLFIAHDLAVVEHISSRILVMYLGRIVESGPAREICSNPLHPYTKALISAVPSIDPATRRNRIFLPGDVPSPLDPPHGCPFHPRCPIARARCSEEVPALFPADSSGERHSACFFASEVPAM